MPHNIFCPLVFAKTLTFLYRIFLLLNMCPYNITILYIKTVKVTDTYYKSQVFELIEIPQNPLYYYTIQVVYSHKLLLVYSKQNTNSYIFLSQRILIVSSLHYVTALAKLDTL